MANRTAEETLSAQLPAPKTFAPSRDDVLSNLAFFFGDPGEQPNARVHLPLRLCTPVQVLFELTLKFSPHLLVHSRAGEASRLLGAPRHDLPFP